MKKKILIIIIFLVFTILNVNAIDYRGDVDGNGKIGTNDYVQIRKHILGTSLLTGNYLKRADTNNDNKITSVDYVLVRKMILSGEKPKPIETPKPTSTPTPKPTPKPLKVLPDTYVVPAGYSVDFGKSYISDSLKYKIIQSNTNTRYYALIWVKNAYKQLNAANDNLNGGRRVTLLSKEVSTMGYADKGLIATNGSFTWDNRANIPVIATTGNIVNNDRYVIQKKDGTPLGYATLAMGSNNLLTYKDTTNVTEARNWISSIGARNTWAITLFETSNWNSDTDGGEAYRTAICQIDENNFVLYVGHSYGTHAYINELHNMFDCKIVVNLDGGGSTGMYYKTKSMSDVSTIYQRQVDNRSIGDMLYFVEE